MSTVFPLPPEVLVTCASYLQIEDLKKATLVSKYLRAVLNPYLYRIIYWEFDEWDSFAPETREKTVTLCLDGHQLAVTLTENPALAAEIHHLLIDWRTCRVCVKKRNVNGYPKARECTLVTTNLLSTFVGLKTLMLIGHWAALLVRLPHFPKLEALTLYNGRQVVRAPLLKYYFQHPKLKSVTMKGAKISGRGSDRALLRLRPDLQPTAQNLSTLILENTHITKLALRSMLDGLTGLKTLELVGVHNHLDHLVDRGDLITLEEMGEVLHEFQGSLAHLSVLGRFETSERHILCEDLCSVLGSLATLYDLKRLIIDPGLLLARSECQDLTSLRWRLPSSFAQLLPPNLESLTLVPDRSQSARIENYRDDILDGVINNRSRLHQLSRITWVERKEYWSFCCLSCSFRYGDIRDDFHNGVDRAAGEAAGSPEVIKRCQDVGIELALDTDKDSSWDSQGSKPTFGEDGVGDVDVETGLRQQPRVQRERLRRPALFTSDTWY